MSETGKSSSRSIAIVDYGMGNLRSVQKALALGGEPELTTAATDAVKQYKFTPYMRCGQAVEFQKVVVVPFAPPANPGDGAILPTK